MEKIIQLSGNKALTNEGNVYAWVNKQIEEGQYKGMATTEMHWQKLPLPTFEFTPRFKRQKASQKTN